MENPFVYGEVVPRSAFVDRHDELKRLAADLLAGQKVFLISPRRYGKSSLIRRALANAERAGCLAVEVTVSSYSSYLAFLEGYARAVLGRRDACVAGADVDSRGHRRDAARGAARNRAGRRVGSRGGVSRRCDRPATSRGWRRRSSPCRRGWPRRAAAGGRRARRVPGHRRRSTAAASRRRCAPPCSISARSATSSPAPSRR